jgi:hypothetical protein
MIAVLCSVGAMHFRHGTFRCCTSAQNSFLISTGILFHLNFANIGLMFANTCQTFRANFVLSKQ